MPQLWMTRMSLFDTAADLEVDLLATAHEDSVRLFNALVYQNDEELTDSHPLVRMWQGYHVAVGAYNAALAATMAQHRISFGTRALKVAGVVRQMRGDAPDPFVMPPWVEDADVLRSHRSNIVRRWPEYDGVWPKTPERMPYLWPFVDGEGGYELYLSKYDKEQLAAGERALPDSIKKRIVNL